MAKKKNFSLERMINGERVSKYDIDTDKAVL